MRTSPLHFEISANVERWGMLHDMSVPLSFKREGADAVLGLADASAFARCGFKGSSAPAWLASLGFPVPERHNHWVALPGGGVVGRLGHTEFFVEDGPNGGAVDLISASFDRAPHDVYVVPRQDAAIQLTGTRALELLAQTCNVNFGALRPEDCQLVMTSMIGVSVLVIPEVRSRFRVWCDPTFGPYLWRTLFEIAEELGGGPIGLARLFPEIDA